MGTNNAIHANAIHVSRGPDGDIVTVNGIVIPGAHLMFRDARRVVINIPATAVQVETRPTPRRVILESEL